MPTKSKAPTAHKMPRSLGACADEVGDLDARLTEIARAIAALSLSKEAVKLTERRAALEAYLIETLPASDASGVAGKRTRVAVKSKRVPSLKDWNALCKHVRKTGDFDLFHRRVSTEAVQARWDEKKRVPGVEGFTVKKLSVTKA